MLANDNKHIKYAAKLKQKKYRDIENKFLIEGLRFVEEAVNEKLVDYLLYSAKIYSMNGAEALIASDVEKYEISEEALKSLCDTENPQGIVAVVRKTDTGIENVINNNKNALLIIADGVQDPGNFGTIVRTADAAGAIAVAAIKGTVDIYNSKTLRATMGSIFHIPVVYCESFEELEHILVHNGYNIFASTPAADKLIYECDFTQNCALIIGNEANGIPLQHMELTVKKVKIPMPGRSESLNAAAAAAIIIYEAVRQRNI